MFLLCFLFYRGTKEVLQKRLKTFTKKKYLRENDISGSKEEKPYTDFYIVIDFEATCEEPNPPDYLHEIIEFPAVLVDAKTNNIVRITTNCTEIIF